MKNTAQEKKKGFTLAELLIVVAILAVLVAIVVPVFSKAMDKAKGAVALANAREAYTASAMGLMDYISAGSPGNGDKAYKINIENEIIAELGKGSMQSFTRTRSNENAVEVGLSLPNAYRLGWDDFISDCKTDNYKNFYRVWVGKNTNQTADNTIKAVYYVSADGKYASRIVYDDTTKLGSVDQKTGSYYQRIDKAGS